MRRFVALTLVSLVAAPPLAAQFEGTVTMKMSVPSAAGAGDMTMKMAIKGDMTATIMSMPTGPTAGMEIRSIMDTKSNTVTTLIPMPANMGSMPGLAGAKGMKNVVDLSKAAPTVGNTTSGAAAELKKLGTSQTIAGMSCDDYEMSSTSGPAMRMCITQSMGRFMYSPMGGGMGGRRGGAAPPPSWTTAFGNKPIFPLKVWSTEGGVAMEVVSVDKGPVSASLFEIPEGYVDMSAMMGGMRPPPR